MSAAELKIMTRQEYLDWEARQETKHEFLDGMVYDVYAMTGAPNAHVTVTLNLAALCKTHLRGTPCRTSISDMKLLVADDAMFYPDVFVTCDPRDRDTEYHKAFPSLIVEVLSPSTAGYDRGSKFAAYRRIETLKEYALIDPGLLTVDLFRRDETGHWVLYPTDKDGTAEFASIGLTVSLADIFEDVEPAPLRARPNLGTD